jgi:hydroxymethylglutaryl-CoA synthase
MKVGIDSIAFNIPKIHLPIATLAVNRNIEPEKLIKGLGLQKMSFPDTYQDVVTFAANAALQLIQQEKLKPEDIARIYIGTESGVDSSKPVASYVIQLLEQKLGTAAFRYCDVVDLTFACIGAVDALQTTLDFIRIHPEKKAIVIATDNAKYDLNSTGEYTQGAGAIAMLITSNPKIIAFSKEVGVSTEGVFDFFKPRRHLSKEQITHSNSNPDWFGVLENEVAIYKEQPIFDGQYSNQCYINRISDAYFHYKRISNQEGPIYQNWTNILMHLPYCFQARRTFVEIYMQENSNIEYDPTNKEQLKLISKSEEYLNFVHQTIYPSEIASGQVGNMYTGSIFLGMLSTFCYHLKQKSNIDNQKMGFIAYGSGSKSKVFEGVVQPGWEQAISKTTLFETLDASTEIGIETYESLHRKELKNSVLSPKNEYILDHIENDNPVLLGARYYTFVN